MQQFQPLRERSLKVYYQSDWPAPRAFARARFLDLTHGDTGGTTSEANSRYLVRWAHFAARRHGRKDQGPGRKDKGPG
jgi:hypothetical protein